MPPLFLPGLFGPNPRIGYRDYLVKAWLTLNEDQGYQTEEVRAVDFKEQRETRYTRLTNRFFQDFKTATTATVPAAQLLSAVLTSILSAPPPLGFGKVVAAAPPGETAEELLSRLIQLSGLTARELGLRYRLPLEESDASSLLSPVELNISTLLAFFRDSFQSAEDPFPTPPAESNSRQLLPIIWDGKSLGRAPFFLEYEEWQLENAPFFPENFFSIQRSLGSIRLLAQIKRGTRPPPPQVQLDMLTDATNLLNKIFSIPEQLAAGQHTLALATIAQVEPGANEIVLRNREISGLEEEVVVAAMAARSREGTSNKAGLQTLEEYFDWPSDKQDARSYGKGLFGTGLTFPQIQIRLALLQLYLYRFYFSYVWKSDALLELGRYGEATQNLQTVLAFKYPYLGAANATDFPGYSEGLTTVRVTVFNENALYVDGALPYTVGLKTDKHPSSQWAGSDTAIAFVGAPVVQNLHPVDIKFVHLRLGAVWLQWADALFRADDNASIARARELYKGVLFLHDKDPGISPNWPSDVVLPLDPFRPRPPVNPAVTAQVTRAQLALSNIASGLTFLGASATTVPVQRYKTLKDAADRFASLAYTAQQDYKDAIVSLEALSIEELRNANFLSKAQSSDSITEQQTKIAGYNITVATQQVAEVQSQIEAKRKEIEDHDSLFGQFKDFVKGVKEIWDDVPKDKQGDVVSSVGIESGLSTSTSAGLFGLGTAATTTAGIGLIVYAGYTSIDGIGKAANDRLGQLKKLQNVTLKLAEGSLDARKAELKIAEQQRLIALADTQLAQSLIAFQSARLLNKEFLIGVAQILRRLLKRYVELATSTAWLAERALAFELNQTLRIIRLDYSMRSLEGVTGVNLLQGDLAELDAARIASQRALAPFTLSISLALDFPLAFGALKSRKTCTFTTSEAFVRQAFPGTYGHRLQSVMVEVRSLPVGARIRGVLINGGASQASKDETLTPAPVMRFTEAMLFSETLKPSLDALAPGSAGSDVLNTFEGSGLDTSWTLELSGGTTASTLAGLSDVVVIFQGLARYGNALPREPSQPGGLLALAASRLAPEAIKRLSGASPTPGAGLPLVFNVASLRLDPSEKNRKVTNVAVILAGIKPPLSAAPIDARMELLAPNQTAVQTTVSFPIADGSAVSNNAPLRQPGSTTADLPLNSLAGKSVEQTWRLFLTNLAPALADISDVLLLIDYTAESI